MAKKSSGYFSSLLFVGCQRSALSTPFWASHDYAQSHELVGCIFDVCLQPSAPVTFAAEYWARIPVVNVLFRHFGQAIFVNRGEVDRSRLTNCSSSFERGTCIRIWRRKALGLMMVFYKEAMMAQPGLQGVQIRRLYLSPCGGMRG